MNLNEMVSHLSQSQKIEMILHVLKAKKAGGNVSIGAIKRVIECVHMSSDLSEMDGIETWDVINLIQSFIYEDHYENVPVFETDYHRTQAIHAIDKLMMNWKGIMLFSRL